MHHLLFFTSQLEIPLKGEEYHTICYWSEVLHPPVFQFQHSFHYEVPAANQHERFNPKIVQVQTVCKKIKKLKIRIEVYCRGVFETRLGGPILMKLGNSLGPYFNNLHFKFYSIWFIQSQVTGIFVREFYLLKVDRIESKQRKIWFHLENLRSCKVAKLQSCKVAKLLFEFDKLALSPSIHVITAWLPWMRRRSEARTRNKRPWRKNLTDTKLELDQQIFLSQKFCHTFVTFLSHFCHIFVTILS